MFEELFYFINRVYTKFKIIKTPALSSFVDICVLIGLNIATICIIGFHFLGISLAHKNIDSTLWGLLFGAIIMIVNYFTLYSRRQAVFEKCSQLPKRTKVKKAIFAAIYVILSLVAFYFSAKAFLPWW